MNAFLLICCLSHPCLHELAWPLLLPLACLLRVTYLPHREDCMLLHKLKDQLQYYFGYL